jgi:hypothetical protein
MVSQKVWGREDIGCSTCKNRGFHRKKEENMNVRFVILMCLITAIPGMAILSSCGGGNTGNGTNGGEIKSPVCRWIQTVYRLTITVQPP